MAAVTAGEKKGSQWLCWQPCSSMCVYYGGHSPADRGHIHPCHGISLCEHFEGASVSKCPIQIMKYHCPATKYCSLSGCVSSTSVCACAWTGVGVGGYSSSLYCPMCQSSRGFQSISRCSCLKARSFKISVAPPPMESTFVSRKMRSDFVPCMYPIPPRIWTASPATDSSIAVAYNNGQVHTVSKDGVKQRHSTSTVRNVMHSHNASTQP